MCEHPVTSYTSTCTIGSSHLYSTHSAGVGNPELASELNVELSFLV